MFTHHILYFLNIKFSIPVLKSVTLCQSSGFEFIYSKIKFLLKILCGRRHPHQYCLSSIQTILIQAIPISHSIKQRLNCLLLGKRDATFCSQPPLHPFSGIGFKFQTAMWIFSNPIQTVSMQQAYYCSWPCVCFFNYK